MAGITANADDNEIIERVKPVGQLVIVEGTAAASPAAATDAAAEAAPATAVDAKSARPRARSVVNFLVSIIFLHVETPLPPGTQEIPLAVVNKTGLSHRVTSQ